MTHRQVLSTLTGRIAAAAFDLSGTVEMEMWQVGSSRSARWHTGHCAASRTAPDAATVRVAKVLGEPYLCSTCLAGIGPVTDWLRAAQLLPNQYTATGTRPEAVERERLVLDGIRRSVSRFPAPVATELTRFADTLEERTHRYSASAAFARDMELECAAAVTELGARIFSDEPRSEYGVDSGWALVIMWAGVPYVFGPAQRPVTVLKRWAQFYGVGVTVGNDYARVVAVPPAVATLALEVERLEQEQPICTVLGRGSTPEALQSAARLSQARLLTDRIRKIRPARACVESYLEACAATEVSNLAQAK